MPQVSILRPGITEYSVPHLRDVFVFVPKVGEREIECPHSSDVVGRRQGGETTNSSHPPPQIPPTIPRFATFIAGGEMKTLSRRDLIKTSLLAPAAVAAAQMGPLTSAIEASVPEPGQQAAAAATESPNPGAGRERLLLDFGWRFHFGHADDPAQDFGFGSGAHGQFPEDRQLPPCRHHRLRRQRLAPRRSAPRLGHRAALPERSRAVEQRLLPAGPELSRHQRRLVSPRVRASRRGRRQAHHDRIRRLVPRNHGGLQRLLHRPPQRRVRSVQLRRDRFCQSRRHATCCWCAWTPPRATAGSTKAPASTGTSGW